jgi:SAM-dependent methyltransferase
MTDLERVVEEIRRWGYSAEGFAERYDRYRPKPAPVLLQLLPLLAGVERPELVVDLGCGTGLSTRFWAEHAASVIGVEPIPEMQEVALAATTAPNVSYRAASAHDTGLPDECADLVTCSQSLQWMEPGPTFAEIARLLRPGRLFAAYEYRWSVTASPAANAAFEAALQRKAELLAELGLDDGKTRWPVTRERFVESGHFVAVDETTLHSVEEIDAQRLVGFALSEGSMSTLLAAGVTEEQVGLDRLRKAAARGLGDEASPWYLGYRLVVGWR